MKEMKDAERLRQNYCDDVYPMWFRDRKIFIVYALLPWNAFAQREFPVYLIPLIAPSHPFLLSITEDLSVVECREIRVSVEYREDSTDFHHEYIFRECESDFSEMKFNKFQISDFLVQVKIMVLRHLQVCLSDFQDSKRIRIHKESCKIVESVLRLDVPASCSLMAHGTGTGEKISREAQENPFGIRAVSMPIIKQKPRVSRNYVLRRHREVRGVKRTWITV